MSHPEDKTADTIKLDPGLKPHVDNMNAEQTGHPDWQGFSSRVLDSMDPDSIAASANEPERHSPGKFRWWPQRVFGYAASGLCALIVGVVVLTGTSQTTFAGVLNRIQQVDTLIMTSYIDTGPGVVTEVVAYYRAPDQIRTETNTLMNGDTLSSVVTFVDRERNESIVLIREQKQAMRIHLPEVAEQADATRNPLFWLDDLRQLPDDAEYTELGTALIDGRQTHGYSIERKGLNISIWADAETDVPLRFEVRTSDEAIFPLPDFEVIGDVQFNPEIDPALFDSRIPAGYDITEIDATSAVE